MELTYSFWGHALAGSVKLAQVSSVSPSPISAFRSSLFARRHLTPTWDYILGDVGSWSEPH